MYKSTISSIYFFIFYIKVPATYAQLLAKPVEVVISCNGAIREVAVSRDDQKWSINFKKALVVLFQAKIDSYSIELEENRVSSVLITRCWNVLLINDKNYKYVIIRLF